MEGVVELAEEIFSNWRLEWDGNNHFGELDEEVIDAIEQFRNHLAIYDFDHADVYMARDYLEPIVGYDKNESQISDENIDSDSVYVVLAGKYVVNHDTDLDELEEQIISDIPECDKVAGIKPLLAEYQRTLQK